MFILYLIVVSLVVFILKPIWIRTLFSSNFIDLPVQQPCQRQLKCRPGSYLRPVHNEADRRRRLALALPPRG